MGMGNLSLDTFSRFVVSILVVWSLTLRHDEGIFAHAANSQERVAVISVEPKYIVKPQTALLTAQLNSTNCSFLSDVKDVNNTPTIQIKGAFKDGSDAVYTGQATKDCSKFVFKLNATKLQQGSYGFSVSVSDQDLPVLQPKVEVMDAPQVAIAGSPRLEQAPNLDMLVVLPVIISHASPLPVTVILNASEPAYVQLQQNQLTWEAGDNKQQLFKARLLSIPPSKEIKLLLNHPSNAFIDTDASEATLKINEEDLPVPVFSFQTNRAVYKGRSAQLQLLVHNSVSSNQSIVKYRTHVLSSTNSLQDGLARASLIVSGEIKIQPGQETIAPVNISVDWDNVPSDAEYRVLVVLEPIRNAQVANQGRAVALFVYGVEPNMCPPGTAVAANSTRHTKPSFSKDAALQDLFLQVCCDDNDRSPYNVPLSPAFMPQSPSYQAIIPFGRSSVNLSFALSQPGDIVSVTNTNCSTTLPEVVRLSKLRAQVVLGNEPAPCVLNLMVKQPESGTSASRRRRSNRSASSDMQLQAEKEQGGAVDTYSMVASYEVAVVPLVNPDLLRVRAISLLNDTTQLVLCGDPSPQSEVVAAQSATALQNGEGGAEEEDGADPNGDAAVVLPPQRNVVRSVYSVKTCSPSECMFINATDMGPGTQLVPETFYSNDTGVEFVNGTFLLSTQMASGHPSAFVKVPITLKANDTVSSLTYEVVVLTVVPQPYPEMAAMEAFFMVKCAVDSQVVNATPISSQNSTTSSSTTEESQQLKAFVFAARSPSFPTHPAQTPNCSVCSNGSYSSRPNAAECQLCPPGQYSTVTPWPTPLPSSCQDCRPGTYTYSWGSASCLPCFPGTYAPYNGSLYCSICPDRFTTALKGATTCPVSINRIPVGVYAEVVTFGVLLNGTTWDQLVNLTGINASSVTILSLLIRTDVASFFNVPIEEVRVTGSHFLSRRALLLNVSATVPYSPDVSAAADTQQLSADDLVQRLNEDPDGVFMRTTKMTGAQVSVTGVKRRKVRLRSAHNALLVHMVLWPTLLGCFMLCGGGFWGFKCWQKRRRRHGPFVLDSQHCWRWVRGSPLSSQGSDRSEMELQELAVNSISSPPRQRGTKQFITDSAYDRFYDPQDFIRK